MSDIYTGIREVPKGKRQGTMKECAELGRISYFGKYKTDPRLIELMLNPKLKEKKMSRDKIFGKLVASRSKVRKLKEAVTHEKNKTKKAQAEKDLKSALIELEKWTKEFKIADKEKEDQLEKEEQLKKKKTKKK
jgi:hypothetical protein